MNYQQLKYEVSKGVGTLTLNRPEQRNALSPQLLAELADGLRSARDAHDVRAVVLTGAGEKAFCAGADLGGFASEAPLVEKHYGSDKLRRGEEFTWNTLKKVCCCFKLHFFPSR